MYTALDRSADLTHALRRAAPALDTHRTSCCARHPTRMLCRTAGSTAHATSACPSRTATEAERLDYTAASPALSELTARAGCVTKDVASAAGAGARSGAQIMLALSAALVRACAAAPAMCPEATQAGRDGAPCNAAGTIVRESREPACGQPRGRARRATQAGRRCSTRHSDAGTPLYTRRLAVEDLGPERALHRLLLVVCPAYVDCVVHCLVSAIGRDGRCGGHWRRARTSFPKYPRHVM
jgi:hypothetical protein